MMETNTTFDLSKGLSLRERILIHLRSNGMDQQILNLINAACDQALTAEDVVLSMGEKKRLAKDIARSILTAL